MSSVTRITGMATGMDTESIVKKLMDVERIPLNKLKQNQQKQTWLLDSYRQWNTDMFAFRNTTLFNMKLSGTYNTYDVTTSNPNSVTGTGTSSALAGNYEIAVAKLASSANFTSNGVKLDTTKALNDPAQGNRALTSTSKFMFKISVNNDPTNPAATQTADIEIDPTKSITDVVAQINSANVNGKSLGVQAIYDSRLEQFIIKTKATGAETKIDFSGNTSPESVEFLNKSLGLTATSTKGSNADITFNGKQVTSFTSNNISLMGINFTLKTTSPLDAVGKPIASTVTVSQNIDTAIKNIKDFVDKYNDILDKLNKATTEAVYRDFLPLTDEQKEEMSEKQIEQWEAKAKSGLLRNDSIMKDLLYKMRNDLSATVNNGSNYNSLASIGIGSKNYQDKGKLYIDETKLRAAFQNDPEAVQKLFSQLGDTTAGTNGLINRLSDTVQQGIKDLTSRAGMAGNSQNDQSIIGKLLSRIQTDINRQNERLTNKENQYYKQFAAMESAVAKFNSQGSWLYSQFNSGM